MAIYITYLLQTLSFSSPFRRFEKEKFLCRSTMVTDNISKLVAPQNYIKYIKYVNYICHLKWEQKNGRNPKDNVK